ncbi:hypothetical protein [Pedobacter sp. KACC 23697]|uniref:O-antigen ligase domain-containing protein n=1 Tax=Pedobacter sp. KACC 23697 TaxID=3149230 RepID=A0AAU7K2V4_9SPHI
MRKFLLYSTLVGVFGEAAIINFGVDLKLLYLIVFINFVILAKKQSILIPRFQIYLFIFLLFSGTFSILNGTNDIPHATEQIIGINVLLLYFYNFFLYFKESVKFVFESYAKACYYLAIIGLIIFIYTFFLKGDHEFRLYSILLEPAHYAGAILPAFYYYIKNYVDFKKETIIVTLSLFLAGSSIGFLGILIAFFIYNKKVFQFKNVIIYAGAISIGTFLYLTVDNVKMRVDDTLKSSSNFDVSGANWSTYALISNLYVTSRVLEKNILLGNGIGSHQLSHGRYIDSLVGVDEFSLIPDLNSKDANSLMLRILSDLGLVGALTVIFLIVKHYSNDDNYYIISRAILIYFFYKLLREGHYFSPEMYFFVMMYYFNYKESSKSSVEYEKII